MRSRFLPQPTTRLAINVTLFARARREMYLRPATSPSSVGRWSRSHTLRVEARPIARARGTHCARREVVAHRTSRLPAPGSVRLPVPADLGGAGTERAQRPATCHACPQPPPQRTLQTSGATEQQRLLEAIVAADQTGDLETLEQLLTADVVTHCGGGGMVHPVRIPVLARPRAARRRCRGVAHPVSPASSAGRKEAKPPAGPPTGPQSNPGAASSLVT